MPLLAFVGAGRRSLAPNADRDGADDGEQLAFVGRLEEPIKKKSAAKPLLLTANRERS